MKKKLIIFATTLCIFAAAQTKEVPVEFKNATGKGIYIEFLSTHPTDGEIVRRRRIPEKGELEDGKTISTNINTLFQKIKIYHYLDPNSSGFSDKLNHTVFKQPMALGIRRYRNLRLTPFKYTHLDDIGRFVEHKIKIQLKYNHIGQDYTSSKVLEPIEEEN